MEAPRIPLLPFAEWDEDDRVALLRFLRRPELYLSGGPNARPMPKVMELFARHRPLADTWLPFSDMLAGPGSKLDPGPRELLILRVAWRTGSRYEWSQHTRMGSQHGVDRDRLYAVADGPDAAVWSEMERALLRAVDEMIDRFCVTDVTWEVLARHFDAAQLLEILFVIGSYTCLAAVFNSAGLEPDPSPEAVDAPQLPAGAAERVK